NLVYEDFLDKFGEEGNMITIAAKAPKLFTPAHFEAWNKLAISLASYPEVENVISLGNLKKLEKLEDPKRFEMVPVLEDGTLSGEDITVCRKQPFTALPFYENLVFTTKSKTVQT